MNEMEAYLARRIRTTGPITLADYMGDCLMHPDHGYYQQERIFGADGDFITAPEISQMFGEMIGLWLANRWHAMGAPTHINLIELGPGRGTLMADILASTRNVAGFHDAVSVHFLELSEQLRAEQQKAVPNAQWHSSLATIPNGPVLMIANEFFDALPIHQFEFRDGVWFERSVTLDDDGNLKLTLTEPSAKFALIPDHLRKPTSNAVIEVSPAAIGIMRDIGDRLNNDGGAALIIDYGYDHANFGDSFQAVKDHRYCDALTAPGKADLTAHVNFESLKRMATDAGLKIGGPVGQGKFLMQLGLGNRAGTLVNGKNEEEQAETFSALKRLSAPDEMGELFRVLSVSDIDQDMAPGFLIGGGP